MIEFLAPWGILIPALSCVLMYLVVSEHRRKTMLADIEAPEEKQAKLVSAAVTSRLA